MSSIKKRMMAIAKTRPRTPVQKRMSRVIILLSIITLFSAGVIIYKLVNFQIDKMTLVANDKSRQVVLEVENFFKPIVSILSTAQQWGQAGILNLSDPLKLSPKLIPLMDHDYLSHLSALHLSDNNGTAYLLHKKSQVWTSRVTRVDTGSSALFQSWDGHKRIKNWTESVDFDPRKRPWFNGAVSSDGNIFWSKPYLFFTLNQLGVTAAVSTGSKNNKETPLVVAVDFLIKDFNTKLSSLDLPEKARVFFINDNGNASSLFPLDKNSILADNSDISATDKNLTDDVVAGLTSVWGKNHALDSASLRFSTKDTKWWGGVFNIRSDNSDVRVGIALPESFIAGEANRKGMLLIILSIIILIVGAVIVVWVAGLYEKNIKKHAFKPHLDDTEDELLQIIEKGEGAELEFKSTLRWNLATNKAGKEIELSCMKSIAAFLNSEGGTLIVGIKDGGEILGIETDNFKNEDKYLLHLNNLIHQHIGLEFSRLISFGLKPVQGRQVLVVDCEKSLQPVFVTHRSEEIFYVRVGPGTQKLQTSAVLEYLKTRQDH